MLTWPHFCIGTLLLLSAGCSSTPTTTATRPSPDAPLRVVTWNIHGCLNGMEPVIAVLRECYADVVLLQEAETDSPRSKGMSQARDMARRLDMHCVAAGSPLAEGGRQEMAILARKSRFASLDGFEELNAGTARIYGVTAVAREGNREIRVVSFHFTATYQPHWQHATDSSTDRLREARDLCGRIDTWSDALIIGGDLNATPGSLVELTLLENLKKAPLDSPTYPATEPVVLIDGLFVSPALEFRDPRVISTTASDHRPAVAAVHRVK